MRLLCGEGGILCGFCAVREGFCAVRETRVNLYLIMHISLKD